VVVSAFSQEFIQMLPVITYMKQIVPQTMMSVCLCAFKNKLN